MKYKLSQKQLDEKIEFLKKMEFDINVTQCTEQIFYNMGFNTSEMEPIALPRPTIRNVEDLKALSEWEYLYFKDGIPWSCRSYEPKTLNLLIRKEATIRQISLPSNSFLLSECIEPEIEESIEVGDLYAYVGFNMELGHNEPRASIFRQGDFLQHGAKLIRKAKDITIEDRVKYLGEKDPRYTPKKSVGAIIKEVEEKYADPKLAKQLTDFSTEYLANFYRNLEKLAEDKISQIEDGSLYEIDGNSDPIENYMLIRKAKDVTESDRIKYLGETPKSLYSEEHHTAEELRDMAMSNNNEPVSKKSVGEIMGDVKLFSDAQLEQISQIIDDKLKERGMLEGE